MIIENLILFISRSCFGIWVRGSSCRVVAVMREAIAVFFPVELVLSKLNIAGECLLAT